MLAPCWNRFADHSRLAPPCLQVVKPSFLEAAAELGSFAAVDATEHEWTGTGVLAIPNSSGIWRPAPRHWRTARSREEDAARPFTGLHVQIWGRTQVRSLTRSAATSTLLAPFNDVSLLYK